MGIVTPTSRAAWEEAVSAYRAAEAALSSHPCGKASPADANYKELAADQSRYLNASTVTLNALFATAAPDAEALVEKIAIYAKEFGNDEELTAVVADVRRFVLRDPMASPIMAMHRRYEQSMAEYLVVERAESQARVDGDENEALALQRGLKALCRETDALRTALMHQVPDNWPEAMVLQFHIVNALDMQSSCADAPEFEREALQTAVDTVFDFMCCEVDQDHGAIGGNFQQGAIRAFFQRRRRTGVVEA